MVVTFKQQEINRNDDALSLAQAEADKKLNILKQAEAEALKYIEISDFKAFSDDMIIYATKTIINKNKAFKSLKISDEKVLKLLDINLDKLAVLQLEYESNKATIYFDKNGMAFTKVDAEVFINFTKNQHQNNKLKTINDFIVTLEALQQYTPIVKYKVAQATSGLLYVDMNSGKLKINNAAF